MMDWLRGTGPLRTVSVSTQTGSTILGVLVEERRDALVLRSARIVGVDTNGNPKIDHVDGDVVIPMTNVDYWQDGLRPEVLGQLT